MKLIDAAVLHFPEKLHTIDKNLFVPDSVAAVWPYLLRNIVYQPVNCGWGYFDGMEYKRPYAICNIENMGNLPSVYLVTEYAESDAENAGSDPAFWLYYYDDKRLLNAFSADPFAILSNNRRFFFWRKSYVDLSRRNSD